MSTRITLTLTQEQADRLVALLSAPAPTTSAPASSPVKADRPKFYSKAEVAAGEGYPCALGCGKRTRGPLAAQSHDSKAEHFHMAAK